MRELVVSWDSPQGRTLTRMVTARETPDEAVEDAVLLAGNLARNEADDIAPKPGPPRTPALSLAAPVPARNPFATMAQRERRLVASASFFFPLATDLDRRDATSALDVNLIYGRIGGIDGAQLGLINVVTPERGRGTGSVTGLEIAALANFVGKDVEGLQIAGGVNVTRGGLDGIELAAIGNSAAERVRGAQVSLGFNRSGGKLEGAQLGLVNTADDIDGVQIGLVNVARRVRGVTVGFVNIADDIDGVPIAPFSVTKSGGLHAVAWSGSSGFASVGVKFATRRTYTLLFGAYHRDFDRDFTGGGLAVGGRVFLGAEFHADIDVSGTYLVAPKASTDVATDSTYHEQLVQPRVRLTLGYRVAQHFGVFVGGAGVGQLRSELGWDRVTASIGPEVFGGVEL